MRGTQPAVVSISLLVQAHIFKAPAEALAADALDRLQGAFAVCAIFLHRLRQLPDLLCSCWAAAVEAAARGAGAARGPGVAHVCHTLQVLYQGAPEVHRKAGTG